MELVIQKSILPVIHANFGEVKTALTEQLKKYEIDVTVENIQEAKTAATEINKVQKSIKELGKSSADLHEKPIKEFKEKIKELAQLCEDARQGILKQCKVFEDARRLEARGKIIEYFDNACDLKGVKESYKDRVDISPAVTLTSLTSKGELNKKTKDQVDLLIGNIFQLQQQDELAEAQAEAKRVAEKAQREQEIAQAKAQAREEALKEEQARQKEGKAVEEPQPEPKPAEPAPKGKSVYRLKLEYEFAAQSGADADKLYAKILPMIQAGKIQPSSHLVVEIE